MPYQKTTPEQTYENYLEKFGPILGARSCKSVTPSDTTDLPSGICRAVYATVAGNINVVFADDDPATGAQAIIFAAGETKSIQARRIYATSTTATGIKAFY